MATAPTPPVPPAFPPPPSPPPLPQGPAMPPPPVAATLPVSGTWKHERSFIKHAAAAISDYCDELQVYCEMMSYHQPGVTIETETFRWRVAALLYHAIVGRPTHLALALPRLTRKGQVMPNYELPNDEVVTVAILTTNSAGTTEPAPAGDVFTVTSSNTASLSATIGTTASGGPAVVLTPLVAGSPGITVTVSDSAGLVQAVQLVDIVADVTPTNIVLDFADATHTGQAVPTNAGP